MDNFKKLIEISIAKEEAQKWYKCDGNIGYETGLSREISGAENEFWNEYVFGTDEFREKYKDGYEIKINII